LDPGPVIHGSYAGLDFGDSFFFFFFVLITDCLQTENQKIKELKRAKETKQNKKTETHLIKTIDVKL
jgi:hypothetical protein